MDPGQISGVHGEVSGLPAPLSAGVTEEQLPELRVYTVATGEQHVRQQSPHKTLPSTKQLFSVSKGDTKITKSKPLKFFLTGGPERCIHTTR